MDERRSFVERRALPKGLTAEKMHAILQVTRELARPFDLDSMLYTVIDAAKALLNAESGTVWQYRAADRVLEMRAARGLEAIRIPIDRGIAGECARSMQTINVPDCYADPRFNREVDRLTGQRTRCMLTLPLVGYDDQLVGVMQVLNRRDGSFDSSDEAVASALAAQCAVALQRMQLTEQLLASEKLRQEIAVAREVQMGTLPTTPPTLADYDLAGLFEPADETGGDTYDFVPADDGSLFVLMGDATGHGIGPALSATQVRAMLRVAQRLGASLDDTYRHINDQLVVDLPEDRFVTAFLGQLDPSRHQLRYHSGGQGPLLHFKAALGSCVLEPPTTFPMGALPQFALPAARLAEFGPGDVFALISDGVYEYQDANGVQFGEQRVADIVLRYHQLPMTELLGRLIGALRDFGRGAPQLDDITIVLLRRRPLPAEGISTAVRERADDEFWAQSFARDFAALTDLFGFIRGGLQAMRGAEEHRYAIEFTAEELFTNMVKYNPSGGGLIEMTMQRIDDELVCRLVDPDCPAFDVTAAPEVDTTAGAGQREPGGLGLHLIRRMVDAIHYDHTGRRGTVTFVKKLGAVDV